MRSNFSKKLEPKTGRVYFISYLEGDTQTYFEFYCVIDLVIDETVYLTITDFVKGNENKMFDDSIQLGWSLTEFNAAYLNEFEDEDLLEISRCKRCGRRLNFVRMALCCPIHNFVGGC